MFFRYVMSLCAIAVLAGCATGGGQNAGSVGIRMSDVDGNVFSGKSSSRFGLSSPNDMWERVQRGFSMPDLDNAIVRDREAWYTRNPNSVSRMLGRSDKYLFHVVEELEPFLEEQLRAAGIACIGKSAVPNMFELNPEVVRHGVYGEEPKTAQLDVKVVARPPALCPGCPHRGSKPGCYR